MSTLDEIEARAHKQATAHDTMIDLGYGIGGLAGRHPEMYEDMLAWDDLSENDHADTVIMLLEIIREQRAQIAAIRSLTNAAPAFSGNSYAAIRAITEATK